MVSSLNFDSNIQRFYKVSSYLPQSIKTNLYKNMIKGENAIKYKTQANIIERNYGLI